MRHLHTDCIGQCFGVGCDWCILGGWPWWWESALEAAVLRG